MEYFKKLENNEVIELSKKLWKNSEKRQKFFVDTYDFYKTKDNLILEIEKVKKKPIYKTVYYDDTQKNLENNFIYCNRYNFPNHWLENYLKEKENFLKTGCDNGQYSCKGIFFVERNNYCVGYTLFCYNNYNERYFIRYLTKEEEKELIELIGNRNNEYLERLKKYYKKYNKYITIYGYYKILENKKGKYFIKNGNIFYLKSLETFKIKYTIVKLLNDNNLYDDYILIK